ncbi:zinc finger BED domain-containing protein RICESLEEPER 2-like [Morus notabilis]|uniref:zinc finger BED domain-containing protein RICESLEEPER 2-like n=1 Tax=Morus notabilis TaxID=981085 RepID=UPI000CED7F17|nr:zinc finger BED domain-containing protein RICESLEEPER 2-like [Morus notabilis]
MDDLQDGVGVNVESDSFTASAAIIGDAPIALEADVEPEANSKNPTTISKRKRKHTSVVWNQFERLPMGADQELKAKCKECGVVYMANSKNGTGSMRRHMQSCVRRDTRDVGQLLMSQDKGSLALSAKRFDAEHFRELITTAIILHDLPFSFVEYEAIRATYQYLHPKITLLTRNTLKADVQKMYSREKVGIKSILELSPGRICLTSDLWTSIVTDGYLSLTAHFIDKDWVLQKRILNFYFMPSPHTGIALSKKLYALLCEWGIEHKVFTLTLDNASANDVSVDLLKNQLIKNNALISDVQEGLKDIDSVVKKIRESVKYVRGSQIRKKKFLECVNLVGLDSKRELSDSNYKNCPNPYDWEKAEKICEFLEPFYNITCVFSGSKYPTANLYFPTVYTSYLSLKKSETNEDAYLSAMAKAMLTKFEKY